MFVKTNNKIKIKIKKRFLREKHHNQKGKSCLFTDVTQIFNSVVIENDVCQSNSPMTLLFSLRPEKWRGGGWEGYTNWGATDRTAVVVSSHGWRVGQRNEACFGSLHLTLRAESRWLHTMQNLGFKKRKGRGWGLQERTALNATPSNIVGKISFSLLRLSGVFGQKKRICASIIMFQTIAPFGFVKCLCASLRAYSAMTP